MAIKPKVFKTFKYTQMVNAGYFVIMISITLKEIQNINSLHPFLENSYSSFKSHLKSYLFFEAFHDFPDRVIAHLFHFYTTSVL